MEAVAFDFTSGCRTPDPNGLRRSDPHDHALHPGNVQLQVNHPHSSLSVSKNSSFLS